MDVLHDQAAESAPTSQLDEPVLTSIKRDLTLIVTKILLVLDYKANPRQKYESLRRWDLWGPLLLVLMMSLNMSVASRTQGQNAAQNNFTTVFMVYVLGAVVITLNARLLKAKMQTVVSILGYCTCPIVILAFILSVIGTFGSLPSVLKAPLIVASVGYSILCASRCLIHSVSEQKHLLVSYPIAIDYMMLGLLLFAL